MSARFKSPGPVPAEARDFIGAKTPLVGWSWEDVWRDQHAHAFTVAKITELDVLDDFRRSIRRAIETGQGFETWRKEIGPILEARGWSGPREVADPTGKRRPRRVDISQPYRLRRIFDANVRTAFAAGQWRQAQRAKATLPYFKYIPSVSENRREEHKRWYNFIAPVDHPFWRTHFPPNGWNCKCAVRQISAREAGDAVTPEAELEAYQRETRAYTNTRTGEVTRVPLGIDPGWDVNPGLDQARTLVDAYAERLAGAPETEARAAIEAFWASGHARDIRLSGENLTLPVAVSRALAERFDAASAIIAISTGTVRRKLETHAEHGLSEESFAGIQTIVTEGEVLNADERHVDLTGEINGISHVLGIHLSRQAFLYVATLFPIGLRDLRRRRRNERSR